jgi:hypothetical protein
MFWPVHGVKPMIAIHLESALRPDEVRGRLGRVVGPRVRNASATATLRPLVGRVDAGSFRVRRRTARRAMWQSTLSGRFAAEGEGTKISVDFPAAAPLVFVALMGLAGLVHGDPAMILLVIAAALIAAAAVAYDALRAVTIVRDAVDATRNGLRPSRAQRFFSASHSERKIA